MASFDDQISAANEEINAAKQSMADLEKELIELTAYKDSVNTEIVTPNVAAAPNTDVYYLYSQEGIVNVGASNGGIIFPTGTTLERPDKPVGGTVRYNSNTQSLEIYTSGWEEVGSGAGGSSGGGGGGAVQGIFYENSAEITANYTSPFGKNIMSTGPLILSWDNVFVEIANSSVWTII